MRKFFFLFWLIPLVGFAQQPNDTLVLKSANGTIFGLYITNAGVLEVVNFGQSSNGNPGQQPSVGFNYSAIVKEATDNNIQPPSAGLQALQQTYFNKLDSIGFLDKCDFFYLFINDGSPDFGLINWAKPSSFKGTPENQVHFDSLTGFSAGNTKGYVNTILNLQEMD